MKQVKHVLLDTVIEEARIVCGVDGEHILGNIYEQSLEQHRKSNFLLELKLYRYFE